MPFDSSHLMSTVSLVGSVATAVATAYFWAVRVRREQPYLKIYSCDRATEVNLGVYRGETRGLQFRASVIVANYSSMPNAAIGVEVALKRRDGAWEEIPAPRGGLALQHSADDDGEIGPRMVGDFAGAAGRRDVAARRDRSRLSRSLLLRRAQIRRVGLVLGEREFRAVLPLLPERGAAAPLAQAA